jgi:hypothetical protein
MDACVPAFVFAFRFEKGSSLSPPFPLFLCLRTQVIALNNFSVFQNKGYNSYKHGILGMLTMCLGLLQPLNAILRPKYNPDSDAPKTTLRIAWEYFHKGTGYAALLLAVVTIGYGTVSLPDVDDQKTFQMAYGIGVGGILFLLVVILQYDRMTYKAVTQEDSQIKKVDEEEQNSMLEAKEAP